MRKTPVLLGMLLAAMANSPAFAGDSRNQHDAGEVTISSSGNASDKVVIETLAVAVKETETKEQLSRFGEVYAFSPSFFAVRRDQPVQVELWNLQPDDKHDFTLVDPDHRVLVTTMLEPLARKEMILTFHREGLYRFRCNIHQPEMSGQILVLPPSHGD